MYEEHSGWEVDTTGRARNLREMTGRIRIGFFSRQQTDSRPLRLTSYQASKQRLFAVFQQISYVNSREIEIWRKQTKQHLLRTEQWQNHKRRT